jgi:TolA-binding protein
MRSLWVGLFVLCLLPASSFAQKREFVELQRDVAALQDQVRNLDRSSSENMGKVTALLQQAIDNIAKLNTTVAVLDAAMRDRDKSVAAPVANVGAKVDQMASGFEAMRVSVDDMNSRLGKLQQNMVDLQNTIKVIQAPPALPAPSSPGGGPGAAAAGQSCPNSDTLYSSAMSDKNGGKDDLALQEFNDYLTCYGSTVMAPNAQYYIGEVLYNRKDYENGLKAFDMVLERYPENNKTLDAMYMKGRTLVQLNEKTKGAEEFRAVYAKSPRSELGLKAKAQLTSMGLSTNSSTSKRAPVRKKTAR